MSATILGYNVYAVPGLVSAAFEGSRKTAHHARRLVRALERQGFTPSVSAAYQDAAGITWCEEVVL